MSPFGRTSDRVTVPSRLHRRNMAAPLDCMLSNRTYREEHRIRAIGGFDRRAVHHRPDIERHPHHPRGHLQPRLHDAAGPLHTNRHLPYLQACVLSKSASMTPPVAPPANAPVKS